MRGAIFLAVMVSLCADTAAAQESDTVLPGRAIALPAIDFAVYSPAERVQLLERWTRDAREWSAWFARWRNRSEPGWFSSRQRRPAPVPPAWLPAACSNVLEDAGPLVDACQAWRDWRRDDLAADLLIQQTTQVRQTVEAPEKTLWWERVHVDAFWPMTRSGTSAFGVAGVHTTLHLGPRLQVFMTPGAILMRIPGYDGEQTWTTGTHWGFSYGLFDFRMPGLRRASTVHFNLARVWILGTSAVQTPGDLYLAGFSVTFKRR